MEAPDTLKQMRRLVVVSMLLLALALPAGALALQTNAGDGSLVVKNGSAPRGQAVVQLVVTGSSIGWVHGLGKIVIDDANANNAASPEITGADGCKDLADADPRQIYGNARVCTGNDFRFRAVGDTFAITIYGSGVNLVALGWGKAILAGIVGEPVDDGFYSLNGGDFHSLPGVPSKPLPFGTPNG
jgi:hypothetical protein